MKILVLGAGQVGLGIANCLGEQGTEVTIVEKSPDIVQKIRNMPNVTAVVGDALNVDVLKRANAENASHIIATMSSDEQNIIACKFAASLFNIKTKIARIRSHIFLQGNVFEFFLKENFEIDIIVQPELEVSNAIHRIIQLRGAFDLIYFGNIVVIGTKCLQDSEILNTTFKHFQGITDIHLFVLFVVRDGHTFFPTGNDVLLPGDEIYFATTAEEMVEAMRLFGYKQGSRRNLLVVGGGDVCVSLLKKISEKKYDYDVTILENSTEKAEEIAEKFPDYSTILGDALDHDLLREVSSGIHTAVLCTGSDRVNILSALFLNEFKVDKVVALANSNNYDSLLAASSGGIVVNPSAIAIETIIERSRRGKVSSVIPIRNHALFVVEAEVAESCKNLGGSIMSIAEKGQIIPIFIERSGNIFVPKKNEVLSLGDRIILLVTKNNLKLVEKFFSNYFFVKEPAYSRLEDDGDIEKLIDEEDDMDLLSK